MSQRNVPGIDCAYLAMDAEEGVEVVWNEVQFSERKSYKAQEVCLCGFSCLLKLFLLHFSYWLKLVLSFAQMHFFKFAFKFITV